MVRRRLTLKRIDPWSVLKFGFVANLVLLAIVLLGAAVVWFFVQNLGLIDAVCGAATEVGFSECSVDGGNLFRALLLLGLLGVVIQTGLFVFLSFLHNLIADLVGGLTFGYLDETPGSAARGEASSRAAPAAGATPSGGPPPPLGTTGPRPADLAGARDRTGSADARLRDAAGGTHDTTDRSEQPARGRVTGSERPMFGDRSGTSSGSHSGSGGRRPAR